MTFKQLFGGGRRGPPASMDETDILESGIDIIAQPPGKKLQNVSLALGRREGDDGDRSHVRHFPISSPSPFCLLDEVDAPLDDANVGRFISMLRRASEARPSSSSSPTIARRWRWPTRCTV